jgi:hypothetical protein
MNKWCVFVRGELCGLALRMHCIPALAGQRDRLGHWPAAVGE